MNTAKITITLDNGEVREVEGELMEYSFDRPPVQVGGTYWAEYLPGPLTFWTFQIAEMTGE